MIVSIPSGVKSEKFLNFLALVDTGSSRSLANRKVISARYKKQKNTDCTGWSTQAGEFRTNTEGLIDRVKLPQFTEKRSFGASFHLFEPSDHNKYDFIIGRDILQEMKIDILNSSQSFSWDGIEVPMVPRGYWNKSKIAQFWKQESNSALDEDVELTAARQLEEAFAMRKLLASKYEPLDLEKRVDEQTHLTIPERLL